MADDVSPSGAAKAGAAKAGAAKAGAAKAGAAKAGAAAEDAAAHALSVLMDEYKVLSDDIGRRVQLQQQNANVIIVLLTAFTGYLFNYWKDHSFSDLRVSEISCLVVVAPLLGMVGLWRHVDHDSNIIDKAEYIV